MVKHWCRCIRCKPTAVLNTCRFPNFLPAAPKWTHSLTSPWLGLLIVPGPDDEEQATELATIPGRLLGRRGRARPGHRGDRSFDREPGFLGLEDTPRLRHFSRGVARRLLIPEKLQRDMDHR